MYTITMEAIVGKRYRHYKGNEYIVLALGRDSETLEEVVVYEAQYNAEDFGDKSVWVRPRAMFEEEVEHDGERIARFTLVD